ncbi:EAL domain-containing protein [Leptolyngbya sp. FACHB-261]|uniref:EAL domain-containing protein n=1 Tax=Leptolyngbya sp. FACHB-261 TaxID=2692806 RepID=UPI001683A4D6|nr:EAL domain-containing protein [Leptolyngbya sp. FACHB-261]MBD2102003.1 EAL domain-containing protein [Leptolyngbya sp. FACHB-261]
MLNQEYTYASMDTIVGGEQQVRHLLVIEYSQGKQIISLEESTYSIGRDPSNSIVLHSKEVSRQHATLLRLTNPKTTHYSFRIIDSNLQGKRSTNGLFVNGQRCFSHSLKHGDVVVFGGAIRAKYYIAQNLSNEEILQNCGPEDISGFLGTFSDSSQMLGLSNAELDNFDEAALLRLASFPELIPNPIFEILPSGELTYLNPATNRQFPDLRRMGLKHPILTGLLPIFESRKGKYFVREVEVGNQVFKQFVHCIYESDLIRSCVINITKQKRTEEALYRSETKNRAILNAIPDLMLQLSKDGTILEFKPAKDYNLSVPSSERVGKNLRDILPLDVAEQAIHYIKQALHTHETQVFEYQLALLDELRHYEVRIVVSSDHEVLAIVRNITERKQFEERLLYDALHDTLTGLPNRTLLMQRLAQVIEQTKEFKNQRFAVLFVDLDRFKFVNDSLGHILGDQLLIAISRRFETCLRAGDTVARLGGDEFAILLENINGSNDATCVAERIQEELALPFNLNNHEVFITASVGIVLETTNYEKPEELLRDADTAMYHAKSLGKARYNIFDQAMHARVLALLQLDNDLRRAVERQEFQVYYQPIVSLTTGRITGFEALARWQHPSKGMILPSEFIQLAEETGLIVPIGEWVLHEACYQASLWQARFPSPLTISVNLSGRQLTQPDLASKISQILQRTNLAPSNLRLEMTESVIMENTQLATDVLLQLKALDVQLCIDDFGTGYSSLSYLHRFPVNSLKVDRSFVNDIDTDAENCGIEITRTIMMLAHKLNIDVVAEGIETAEQLAHLRSLNCQYGQGYFFAKPLNIQAAEALLIDQPSW